MISEDNATPQVGAQTPQAPQAGNSPVTETPQAGETNPSTLTHEQTLAELARVRKEAAANRVKLNEFEEKARLDAEAQLTEAQKAQARAADLERQLAERTSKHQERAVAYEVQLHAAKLGIIDPDAAAKLLDWSQLEYDDDGTPKNAVKLLSELIKAKPYLAGTPSSGSVANPPRNNNQSNTFTNAQIAAMSPDEYRKNRDAIYLAGKEGRITG